MRLRNEEQTVLTVTPYNIAYQLYTVYQNVTTGDKWNAETALQAIAHSSLKHIPNNEQGCISALNYLNNKLEAVRKTISFWDAYQISDAIQDNELLLNKITQLPNNSSLVNNTKDPFIWTNPTIKIDATTGRAIVENTEEKIYQGDIFIKDYQGNVHVIHATNKGVYVPKDLVLTGDGNSLSIVYEYKSSGNEENTITIPPRSSELTTGTNGHWFLNGQDTNADVDEPVTIENGYWYINGNNTGIPASGPTGTTILKPELDSGYNLRGTLSPCGGSGSSLTFSVLFGPTGSITFSNIAIAPIVKFFDDTDQVVLMTTYSGPYDSNGYVDPTTITSPRNDLWWSIYNPTPIELHFEVR